LAEPPQWFGALWGTPRAKTRLSANKIFHHLLYLHANL